MILKFTVFWICIWAAWTQEQQKSNITLKNLAKTINREAYEWIGILDDRFEEAYEKSDINTYEQPVLQLLRSLQTQPDMTQTSVSKILEFFQKNKKFVESVKQFLSASWTRIDFLNERQKAHKLKQYVSEFPKHCEKIFDGNYDLATKGEKLGKFINGLMEWYYVSVVSQDETLSTVLLRSITAKIDIFDHKDLSFCIDIDQVGIISEKLEDLDINSIFLKIPDAFNVLKKLILKESCLTEENRQRIRRLADRIRDVDMFRIMYDNYEPYVDIATENYGLTRVKMLAREFAKIIDDAEAIVRKQKETPHPLKAQEKQQL